MTTSLFDPVTVGAVELPNRVLMAPLTRQRATPPGQVPNDLMREYYEQRAGAGLIVSEGTQISPEGQGYADTPGIHSPEQQAGWRRITDAVHAAGGRMSAQLWHTGRVNHESLHDGEPPVSASAVEFRSRTSLKDEDGQVFRASCPTPRAATSADLTRIVGDYAHATRVARDAGFDLVELHGAHGYLLHQFLSPTSNQRDDEYGGSVENRARLLLESVDASIDAWSADRVGIRISPIGTFNGLEALDEQAAEDGLHVAAELGRRGIAYLHLSEPDWAGGPALDDDFRKRLRDAFGGTIIGAGAYTTEKAERLLEAGLIDAVAFGRDYIANPDLAQRIESGAPLNDQDASTFYGGGASGYTDYPALA